MPEEPADPIRDLLARYADAVCGRDRTEWAATWVPDATWDLGGGREVTGLEAIVDLWQSAMDRYPSVEHRYEDNEASLDETTGTGRGRAHVHEITRTADGTVSEMRGHYDDEYRRTADGWRFARRTLVRLPDG